MTPAVRGGGFGEHVEEQIFPSTRDAITKEDPSVDSPDKKFGRLSILSRKEERKDPAQPAEPEEAPVSPIRRRASLHPLGVSFIDQSKVETSMIDAPNESKISRTLSDKTIKTVILLTPTMLFLMPLFQSETFFGSTTSFQIGLNTLVTMYNTGSSVNYDITYNAYLSLQEDLENPLIYLQAANKGIWQQTPDVTDLRLDEYETYSENAEDGSEFLTVWSLRF